MKISIIMLFVYMPLSAFAVNLGAVEGEIAGISLSQDSCHEHAMSTVEINECEYNAHLALDKLLNKVYKQIFANYENFVTGMGAEHDQIKQENFRESQRAWLKFRDANCQWQADQAYGGTAAGYIGTGCSNGMTKERIKAMAEYYQSI